MSNADLNFSIGLVNREIKTGIDKDCYIQYNYIRQI